ncbi:MAG TPA: response regulator [Polyangia bacterium]|jgi:FixJ family two-component response regulator|nr:response regulator [Polyangia bacterium]
MTLEPRYVFLVDDDPVMLFLWGGILRSAGYQVEAFDRPEALMERLSPGDRGCAVVDLRMPGLNGLELQRALRARGVTLSLIFVSGSADVQAVVTALKGGAVDFLSKPVDPRELCAVVERALQEDTELTKARACREHARARWAELSPREREVCRLLAKGLLDKQIAAALGTAATTVQAQRTRAFQKLRMGSATELVQLLAQAGEGD